MTVKDASLELIVGSRGMGKSHYGKRLIAGNNRLIIFDPTGEYGRELKGVTVLDSGPALVEAVAAGWNSGFRIAYQPPHGWYAEALHALGAFLLQVQEPYKIGRDTRQVTLLVEEMNLGYPVAALPRELSAMPQITLQGRHSGINVIGLTQRPALVSKDYRANIDRLVIFALAETDDRDAVLKKIGREHEPALRALKARECLIYHNGEVRAGP